jgi:AcrR family transcriptional regulator
MKPAAVSEPRRASRKTKASEVTRMRILEVAERLFAEVGVDGTSLRRIMAEAQVSISQINYHFGTKEALLRAVFEWRARPHTEHRLRLMEQAKQAPHEQRLEAMLRGYFAPVWSYLSGKTNETNFYRLLNRIGTDPGNVARSILAENFDDFQHRFIDNLHELLPHVSEQDLYWRLHCLLGVLMYSTNNLDRLHRISGGRFECVMEMLSSRM